MAERRFGKRNVVEEHVAMFGGIIDALKRPADEHSHAAEGMREILGRCLPPINRRRGPTERRQVVTPRDGTETG